MKQRILLGLTMALAVSACGKKAEGQTVAVVNGEEITASELNAELAALQLPPNADKKAATASTLQTVIDRHLLAAQAKKEGIDRSPEYITKQRRISDDLLISMLASRQLETTKLPGDAAINDLIAKRPQAFDKREVWRLQQVVYMTPTDKAVLDKIAQTKTLDQLIAVLTAAGQSFTRATNQIVTDTIPTEIYPKLTALAPGEPFIVPSGQRSVASAIVSKEPAPITGPAARAAAAQMIRQEGSTTSLQQRLKDLRANAKVEYKEGFGPPAK